jgi:transcriptional regulator with PAS, ATPase and Fis domain
LQGDDPGSPKVVYVWDSTPGTIEDLDPLLANCGARAEYVSSAGLDTASSLRAPLAIVALTRDGENDAQDAIRHLKQRDVEVLAIAQQTQTMSITERCRVLLAGASALLDFGSPDFARHLQLWIQEKLESQQVRSREAARVRSTMAEMQIIGESAPLLRAFQRLLKVSALSDVPVLLSGESGTGKELFAHALQRLDPKRSRGPFVSVNCAAISAQLVESELFGHRKGSFTGAERHRKGLIRGADGGTLFLDEVGELEIGLQAKLLRVLQEKRVLGVGDEEETPVDVRFIAATNRSLDDMVRARTFREDLYHRLNVVSILIPPLRERSADIRLLATHFLLKHAEIAAGHRFDVSDDFVNALGRLELRGNARELENIVRQVLLNKGKGAELTLLDLPEEVLRRLVDVEAAPDTPPLRKGPVGSFDHKPDDAAAHELQLLQALLASGADLSTSLERCERILLQAALRRARGNQSQTARLLGITPRSVYNKLRRHNLVA